MHPGWTPPTQQGRVALAFRVADPSDVDALFERIADAGHPGTPKPFDAPWGQPMRRSPIPTARRSTCSARCPDAAPQAAFR
jgi:hypothetical protein